MSAPQDIELRKRSTWNIYALTYRSSQIAAQMFHMKHLPLFSEHASQIVANMFHVEQCHISSSFSQYCAYVSRGTVFLLFCKYYGNEKGEP